MPTDRRKFLQGLGVAAGAGLIAPPVSGPESIAKIAEAAGRLEGRPLDEAARDETYWATVRAAFPVEGPEAYFRSGWTGVMASCVQEAVKGLWDRSNRMDPDGLDYKTNGFWWEALSRARRRLAAHVNAAPEELTFTRNTTEAVNTVLLGLDLKPGDEVLTSDQDYYSFHGTLLQRQAREGVVFRTVPLPTPAQAPGEIVGAFERGIGPKTRALLCCHVYVTGQIAPVRAIVEMAHARGVQVVVDGALAFGHPAVDLSSMGCDYYGGSFHKAAGGPRGTGFLHVRRDRIGRLWPLHGSLDWISGRSEHANDSIDKLANHGTSPDFLYAAVPTLLDLHEAIGVERRVARLQYLKRHWTDRVKDLPGVRFSTSLDPELSCALTCLEIRGVDPARFDAHLGQRCGLLVGSTMIRSLFPEPPTRYQPNRIWVNVAVFNTPAELDRLAEAVEEAARRGLPS